MIGKIIAISGPTVSVDISGLKLYDRVEVGERGLQGEVVRLAPGRAVVQVYEDTRGLALGEPAKGLGCPLSVELGPGLLGATYDGLQRPLDRIADEFGPFIAPGRMLPALLPGATWEFSPMRRQGEEVKAGECVGVFSEGAFSHPVFTREGGVLAKIAAGKVSLEAPVASFAGGGELFGVQHWPIRTPRPYRRKLSPQVPLVTGQRVIDFLFPLAKGGTAILPGGFGTGKTILEQAIAKFADVDVVVYVGCGERGNEMAELLEEFWELNDPWTGRRLMDRTILLANTSNMPVAAREASIYTAATMAEYYRDLGFHVLLLADSLSRWAEALREISAALEEMPGEEGFPTYLASRLNGFFSRAGVVENSAGQIGSVTMVLSVSPPGGDFTEPATQACLRSTGAFLMLDTELAHRRHFPAVNWLQSYSLYEAELEHHFRTEVFGAWPELKKGCWSLLRREEKIREVAAIVGAEGLQDEDHLLLEIGERIRQEFLCQNSFSDDAFSTPQLTAERIGRLINAYRKAHSRLGGGEALSRILRDMKTCA